MKSKLKKKVGSKSYPSQVKSPVPILRSQVLFENTFKNIDNILYKDAGCTGELDYVEQTSWVLFLKYIEDLEIARKVGAELGNKKYIPIISGKFRWSNWAAPKNVSGKIDHNTALTGDDLKDFVNKELFPFLAKFKSSASSPTTLEYKIGEIFSEVKNKIQGGYNLREVLELVDELRFQTSADIHEMSHLYEAKIKNMGNAGRNGGEYYTPRPLIKAIIEVINPKIGDKIYDGSTGSAGFLCESYIYLRESKKLSTKDIEILQKSSFFGKEKKSLPYIIGTMNMILHGIDAPNIKHTNTLSEKIADIQDKDRYDIILANPPFGGKERSEVKENFPIKTGETAYLFLQHFMKILRAGGSAGIVIKNTFLSNPDNASVALRKELLENHNLHTILDCPSGTFQGKGTKTVVLFFKKGEPTKKIWYYQLKPGRNMGKTNPLTDMDLEEFIELQKKLKNSDLSWSIDVSKVNQITWDLSVKNPNGNDGVVHQSPEEIISEIESLDVENQIILQRIKELL
jgi:type I restriction enzyme M protein